MLHDAVDVGVLCLQYLLNPMFQLDIGVAAQLAEDSSALDRFVSETVELSKQGHAADFAHTCPSPSRIFAIIEAPSAHRSTLSTHFGATTREKRPESPRSITYLTDRPPSAS